jgi:hypothetical protein
MEKEEVAGKVCVLGLYRTCFIHIGGKMPLVIHIKNGLKGE